MNSRVNPKLLRQFIVIIAILISAKTFAHPLHVSYMYAEYNRENNTVSCRIKLHLVDLLNLIMIEKGYSCEVLQTGTINTEDWKVIEAYINEQLQIYTQHEQNAYTFNNYTFEEDNIWLYSTYSFKENINELYIYNNLMLPAFKDQKNLLIFAYNGFQKGISFDFFNSNTTIQLSEIEAKLND